MSIFTRVSRSNISPPRSNHYGLSPASPVTSHRLFSLTTGQQQPQGFHFSLENMQADFFNGSWKRLITLFYLVWGINSCSVSNSETLYARCRHAFTRSSGSFWRLSHRIRGSFFNNPDTTQDVIQLEVRGSRSQTNFQPNTDSSNLSSKLTLVNGAVACTHRSRSKIHTRATLMAKNWYHVQLATSLVRFTSPCDLSEKINLH